MRSFSNHERRLLTFMILLLKDFFDSKIYAFIKPLTLSSFSHHSSFFHPKIFPTWQRYFNYNRFNRIYSVEVNLKQYYVKHITLEFSSLLNKSNYSMNIDCEYPLKFTKLQSSIVVPTGVTLKIAVDTSNSIRDDSLSISERFTSSSSLDLAHRLRRCCDAILVGRTTIQNDNCSLTVRRVNLKETGRDNPQRVVLDPGLCLLRTVYIDKNHKNIINYYTIFNDSKETLIYYTSGSHKSVFPELSFNNGIIRMVCIGSKKKSIIINPLKIIRDLQDRGKNHIMVEGGAMTAKYFLVNQVIERAILINSPRKFRRPLSNKITKSMMYGAGLKIIGSRMCGKDMIDYWARLGASWPSNDLKAWP